MADDKRKKKRGRKIKNNLPSCFPSFASYNYKSTHPDTSFRRQPSDCNSNIDSITTDVDNDPHRRRISRLFKAVNFFDSFLVKKKINRSSSKSSATSDTSESASSISSEKTMKSLNNNNTIHVKESPDLDSSLVSSCSRTTSSSNSSSFCCSSTNSNSHWSSEPKTTSSRLDLVDFKPNPNPNPNPISSINSTTPPDPPPKVPNKPVSSRTLVSSNSLPLPKPNHDHDHNHNRNHNRNKIKSSGTNRNNLLWCLFVLLSLVVLVVYGRIYSILCTSTWFYFVPCRKMKRVNSVGNNSVKVADTDSEQYKKRVIMAGLLDRTRNPIR